jgi:hypothetical protein
MNCRNHPPICRAACDELHLARVELRNGGAEAAPQMHEIAGPDSLFRPSGSTLRYKAGIDRAY